jgi:type IV pilus assembly protein PilW
MFFRPLVEGIEDMQIEFGIDTNDVDLAANYFESEPDETEIPNVVSARIFLLVRSLRPITGYENTKTYQLGNKAVPAFNDGFYRRVYSTSVPIRNAEKLKLQSL